ncbi:MAG: two-component system LytT family response regulator [Flavobacteriales bacterium]|jgi:two-component system LytT family response regulator
MEKLTAMIIDDEKDASNALKLMIESYCPDIQLLYVASQPEQGIKKVRKLKPLILFLDIEMPNMSGFDVLESLQDMTFYTVFYTTFSKYAIDAIKHNAFDYILKPLVADDLMTSITRVKKAVRDAAMLEQLDPEDASVLSLRSGSSTRMVNCKKIMQIHADGSYSKLNMKDGENILVSRNLKTLSKMIDNPDFLRIHNSHLVNAKEVDVWRLPEGICVLSDGSELPISTRRKDEVRNYLTV